MGAHSREPHASALRFANIPRMKSALADLYHAHVADRAADDGASPRRDRLRPAPPPLRHALHLLRRRQRRAVPPDAPLRPLGAASRDRVTSSRSAPGRSRASCGSSRATTGTRRRSRRPTSSRPRSRSSRPRRPRPSGPRSERTASGPRSSAETRPRPRLSASRAAAVNPKALVARLDWERSFKSAYEVETLAEATVPAARGFRAAEEAFRDGGDGDGGAPRLPRRRRRHGGAPPLPDDHRVRRALRDAPLPRQARDLGRAGKGDARRRGRRRSRLRLRHHPDLRRRRLRPALPRPHQRDGSAPEGARRRSAPRHEVPRPARPRPPPRSATSSTGRAS